MLDRDSILGAMAISVVALVLSSLLLYSRRRRPRSFMGPMAAAVAAGTAVGGATNVDKSEHSPAVQTHWLNVRISPHPVEKAFQADAGEQWPPFLHLLVLAMCLGALSLPMTPSSSSFAALVPPILLLSSRKEIIAVIALSCWSLLSVSVVDSSHLFFSTLLVVTSLLPLRGRAVAFVGISSVAAHAFKTDNLLVTIVLVAIAMILVRQRVVNERNARVYYLSAVHHKSHQVVKARPVAHSSSSSDVDLTSPIQRAMNTLVALKQGLGDEERQSLDTVLSTLQHSANIFQPEMMAGSEMDADIHQYLVSQLRQPRPTESHATVKAAMKWRGKKRGAHMAHHLIISSMASKAPASPTTNDGPDAITVPSLGQWDFDVWAMDKATDGSPLVHTLLYWFQRLELFDALSVSKDDVAYFGSIVERGYVAKNPYHNHLHASDVVNGVGCLLLSPRLRRCKLLSQLDMATMIVAAALHDYEHDGVSNNFHVAMSSELALRYNDQSILEAHSASVGWKLLVNGERCLLRNLDADQKKSFRSMLIGLVLATDLAQHFDLLGRFKSTVVSLQEGEQMEADLLLLTLKLVIKCADVGTPTRKHPIVEHWAEQVMEEFFIQGEKENEQGISVSPFRDRAKTVTEKVQVGFIDYCCLPLFSEVAPFLGMDNLLVELKANKAWWQAKMPH